jgi:hypothetical protein
MFRIAATDASAFACLDSIAASLSSIFCITGSPPTTLVLRSLSSVRSESNLLAKDSIDSAMCSSNFVGFLGARVRFTQFGEKILWGFCGDRL